MHAVLQERAKRDGRSLQQFLIAELRKLAQRPSSDELLDRIERGKGGRVGLAQAVADLDAERERR